MITSLLIYFVLSFMVVLSAVLPVGSLPTEVEDAFDTAFGYLAGWNSVFPIDTLLTVLGYSLAFQTVLWLWEFGVWLYGRIRGVSSK